MKRTKDLCRRCLALILSFVLCVGMLSTTAFATEGGEAEGTEVTETQPAPPPAEPVKPEPKPEVKPEPTPEVKPEPPAQEETPEVPDQTETPTEPEEPDQTETPAKPEEPGQAEQPDETEVPGETEEPKPEDPTPEETTPKPEPTPVQPAMSKTAQAFIAAVNAIPRFDGTNGMSVTVAGTYASSLLETQSAKDYENEDVLAAMIKLRDIADSITDESENLALIKGEIGRAHV